MKITFSKPYVFEGETFEAIELDFDGLTGRDVSAVKREWQRRNNFSPVPSTDIDFCAYLAAKAAKKPFEFVEGLPAKDFCLVAQTSANFLLG